MNTQSIETTTLPSNEAKTPDVSAEPVRTWRPAVDIFEGNDDFLLTADLPGVKPEHLDVQLDDRTLTLSARRFLGDGTRSVAYERAFTLPRGIDPEGLDARLSNGVLTLTVKKSAASRVRNIPIQMG